MMLPQLVHGRHGIFIAYPDDNFLGEYVCKYGEYGEEELRLLLSLLSQDDVMVEVGANAGYLTIPLAKRAYVYAIEPQAYVYRVLMANVHLNALERRVVGVNVALGSMSGTAFMPNTDYGIGCSHGSCTTSLTQDVQHHLEVPMMTLDSLNVAPPRLLKIDVEGFELEVLKGATETITKHQPLIYLENDRKDKSEELITYLWSIGYDCCFHLPNLFNKNNFFKDPEEKYKDVVSYNMLCAPKSWGFIKFPVVDSKMFPVPGTILPVLSA